MSNELHDGVINRLIDSGALDPRLHALPRQRNSASHKSRSILAADSTLCVLSYREMIRTLADDTTRDIWNGVNSKAARRIPRALWRVVQRKLDQIDSVTKLDDLRVPPGNRLHTLSAELAGYRAIRVNDQYRIVFRFEGHDAYDVRCADYH